MRQHFELGSLLQVLLASIALAPAGCGGSSVEENGNSQGGGTGGTGTGGTSSVTIGECKSENRLDDSGWVQCERGLAHRETVGTCPSTVPRPPTTGAACADADCAGMPYGHCWPEPTFGAPAQSCIPGCVMDADCAAGQVCFCEAPVGRCIPADCSEDADCGPGSFCSTYVEPPVPSCSFHVAGAKCQTKDDACTGEECNCAIVNGARACVDGLGGCGRPFLVEGAARRATAERRADWSTPSALPARLDALDAETRAKLAEHWTQSGLLEHASIAAFARFALELVALGAPAELVAEAAAAMTDETRHARLCFALAGHYAGTPVGPGPLSVEGSLSTPTLASVVKTVVLEGCIGETVAAAEARELASVAKDPVVRELLGQIASDETRHAALAYRFLCWALGMGGAELGELVRETLSRELEREMERPHGDRDDARALSLGMPTARFRAALRRDVLERVVVPCLHGLTVDADPSGRSTVRAA